MKIYAEKTDYSPERNSVWVGQQYEKYSKEIAKCLSQLDEIKNHVDYLHELTDDAGDVGFGLTDAIFKLGVALADCVNYSEEYFKEAAEEEPKNDPEK